MDNTTRKTIHNLRDDLYEILGLLRTATDLEIKKTFMRLALRNHPDKNPNATTSEKELFKKQSVAYYILGNSERRSYYDMFFKCHGLLKTPKHTVKDLKVQISLKMVFDGGFKEIKVFGHFKNSNQEIEFREKIVSVSVPKGIRNNESIIYEGIGGLSRSGDEIIDIRIKFVWMTDVDFEIKDDNLCIKKTITLKQSLIGGLLKIQMPNDSFEEVFLVEVIKPGQILM